MAASRSASAKTMFGFFPPGDRAARKRDRVDLWMRRDRSADIWSSSVHYVEDTVWKTGLLRDFAKHVSRHRCQLAWFSYGDVTDRDGGRNFPAQQIERQVPRRNQSGDAARLTRRIVESDVVGDMGFRLGVQDRGREETKVGDGPRNVECARKRERLTRVD